MMSTSDDRSSTPPADPEGTFNDFLTYAELLQAPQLARLYTFVLREGPVEIETIKRTLEMPHSTTYKYLGRLEEMGLLTRHDILLVRSSYALSGPRLHKDLRQTV